MVDHKDRNKINNHPSNLRGSTKQQNNCNAKTPVTNTSGVKGVHWCKRSKLWIAQLSHYNKRIRIGGYKNIVDAQVAVELKREELHKEFANHG